MKIVCLCENTPFAEEFQFEHGLSIYIETGHKKILFDMGGTDVFSKNAERLGVDLSAVDIAILSHGHSDHGGGIHKFLELNNKAKIYMSKNAFGDYYNDIDKYIGLAKDLIGNDRLVLCEDYVKLAEGLELFSQNHADLLTPIDSAGLKTKREGQLVPDDFIHEQYLKINEAGKIYLISGCSHKGILNIENWFKPDVLIGGFHLMKQEPSKDNPRLQKTIAELNRFNTVYYTCHCTGLPQYEILKEQMPNNLHYLAAGQVVEF